MKKDEMNVIEKISLDDIKEFKAEENALVMVLKDGQEVTFEVMKDAFDRFNFYQMIDRIKVTKQEQIHSNYVEVEGFANHGNYHLKLNEISKTCGTNDPADVYSYQLEGRKEGMVLSMRSMSSTSALVKDILIEKPASRNSDNFLFYLVCKKLLADQGEDIETMGFTKLFLSLNGYGLPPFETVGRVRRKLQQEFPELQASDEVRLGRMTKCNDFIEYAKEGLI